MRNPDRIDTILDKIRMVWIQYPDMRYGQLLINIWYLKEAADPFCIADCFHYEDDVLEKCLDKFISNK